jgi:hypothetical protein
LLEALKSGSAIKQISRDLAAKLDRTPSAIETRLLKLRRRAPNIVEKASTSGKPASSLVQPKQQLAVSPDSTRLKQLLNSALALTSHGNHTEAMRLILTSCLEIIGEKPAENLKL